MVGGNKKTEKRKEKLRMQLSCLVYRKLKTYLKTENTTTSGKTISMPYEYYNY
jgi:hypothetical protein